MYQILSYIILGIIIYLIYVNKKNSLINNKLSIFLNRKQPLRIYVGFPLKNPTEWILAQHLNDDIIKIGEHGTFKADLIKSFIITYPSGELLSECHPFGPLPDGVYPIEENINPNTPVQINRELIEKGKKYIEIKREKSQSNPHNANYYSISLKNISEKKIHVTRFAAFRLIKDKYYLHTVSGKYFSDIQFQEWYAVASDGWIKPGETATDWDNYGGGNNTFWAYFCLDEDGNEFIATDN